MPGLTKELADALCTAVAIGFMSTKGGALEIINEDPRDEQNHLHLNKILKTFNANAGFCYTFQSSKQNPYPFIFTKTQNATEDVRKGIAGELGGKADLYEQEINRAVDASSLKGAYVGGAVTGGDQVHLIGASDLYLYDPTHRTLKPADTDAVAAAYDKAKRVSVIVEDFLKDAQNPIINKHNILLDRPETQSHYTNYVPQKLFASIHGMTRSLLNYPGGADKDLINFELALGSGTCKVASCMPCSLFMSALGKPATATHLGRGDNWNFPESISPSIHNSQNPSQAPNSLVSPFVNDWARMILSCYNIGQVFIAPLLQRSDPQNLLKNRPIPALFLEALTFESSFLDKMTNTLRSVYPQFFAKR